MIYLHSNNTQSGTKAKIFTTPPNISCSDLSRIDCPFYQIQRSILARTVHIAHENISGLSRTDSLFNAPMFSVQWSRLASGVRWANVHTARHVMVCVICRKSAWTETVGPVDTIKYFTKRQETGTCQPMGADPFTALCKFSFKCSLRDE